METPLTQREALQTPRPKRIRTFTASHNEILMLDAVARYHGFSKSATITSLVKKEFWRIFPQGTGEVRPDPGARVVIGGPERAP